MRSVKLLAIVSILAASTVGAATVTRNPRDFAIGADVSGAFPGVTLTKLTSVPGATTYAPTLSPVTITNCAGYAACALFGSAYALGGNLHGASEHRTCYNANMAGFSSIFCGDPWVVLQATFDTPTDFVQFHWTSLSDPPLMTAYDEAGNEILACGAYGPATCMTTHQFSPGFELMGTIRLTSGSAKIKRVVIGSFAASTRLYMMQYDVTKPVPPCPRR